MKALLVQLEKYPLVIELLAKCNFPSAGTKISCAVSGGPDSMALLILAVASGCEVTAIHVDHALRIGSENESQVVENLAKNLGANFISKTIWHKILEGDYKPQPALNFFKDKGDGSKRSLMAFTIPDTALANVLMRRLRERNIKRFSPHSFAYHPEKNIFDAILDLRSFILETDKIYSVQIDFKKYFDSIPSTYLRKLLDNPEIFSLTPVEKKVLREFLFHDFAQRSEYQAREFQSRRRGTPQGSSISLILANLANHSLDTALEKLPGKFVRFADDVTALCESYEDAVKIEQCFFDHCRRTGIEMNRKKSPGIAVLSNKDAEIRTVRFIDYLGYRFTEDGLILSDKTVMRIQRKISKMISSPNNIIQ